MSVHILKCIVELSCSQWDICRSVSMETSAPAPLPRALGGTPAQSNRDSLELHLLKQAFALFCEHKQVRLPW